MDEKRLAAFEEMLKAVLENYNGICRKMAELKEQGKVNTATYHQLMSNRLVYQSILSFYQAYDLID